MRATQAGAQQSANLCGIAGNKMCREVTAQGRLQGLGRLLHLCRQAGPSTMEGKGIWNIVEQPGF